MSLWTRASLLIGIIVVGLVCVLELWRWYRGEGMISQGQLGRRLLVGILLQFAMAMALVGEKVLRGRPVEQHLVYWTICLVAAVVPLFVAVREVGIIGRYYARRRAELFRDAARAARQERQRPPSG